MSLARYAKKRDGNEAPIVQALRKAGATVWLLDRPVDLLVGYGGRLTALEVKTDRGRLTDEQAAICQFNDLPVYVVRTPEDALRAIGALNPTIVRQK